VKLVYPEALASGSAGEVAFATTSGTASCASSDWELSRGSRLGLGWGGGFRHHEIIDQPRKRRWWVCPEAFASGSALGGGFRHHETIDQPRKRRLMAEPWAKVQGQ